MSVYVTGIEAVEALNPPFPSPYGFTNRQEQLLSCPSVSILLSGADDAADVP